MLSQKRRRIGPLSPVTLVLLAIVSNQMGAVLAKQLFIALGHGGTLSLSLTLAASVMLLWQRPQLTTYSWQDQGLAGLMGLVLVGMYVSLYAAIAQIPLGIAIAFQFVGPLGLSAVKACRKLDWAWVSFAALGIVLLSPLHSSALALAGMGFALLAGWLLAIYMVLAKQVSERFHQGEGLAIALTVSALTLLPFGVHAGFIPFQSPQLWLLGLGVALLSAVVPFSLDSMVLQQTSPKTLGLLLSLEPAIAALLGWWILGEALGMRSIVGMLLITAATAGHARWHCNLDS